MYRRWAMSTVGLHIQMLRSSDMVVDRMHLYLFVGALVPDGDRWMSRRNCADSEFDLMGSVVMEEYGHKFGNQ